MFMSISTITYTFYPVNVEHEPKLAIIMVNERKYQGSSIFSHIYDTDIRLILIARKSIKTTQVD